LRPTAPGSLIGSSRWQLEGWFAAQVQTSRDAPAQRPAWWIGTQPLGLERHRHTGGVIDMSSSR
jgi:hypothetical protein